MCPSFNKKAFYAVQYPLYTTLFLVVQGNVCFQFSSLLLCSTVHMQVLYMNESLTCVALPLISIDIEYASAQWSTTVGKKIEIKHCWPRYFFYYLRGLELHIVFIFKYKLSCEIDINSVSLICMYALKTTFDMMLVYLSRQLTINYLWSCHGDPCSGTSCY